MNLIEPVIFKPHKDVEACFTEKNTDISGKGTKVPGLNLGLNTEEGQTAVEENVKKLFKHLDWDYSRLTLARQVHGNHVEFVKKPGIYENTDALVTNRPGLILGIQVADCAAVLLAAPEYGIIGAAHAGWRGALAGIVAQTVSKMKKLGARRDRMIAFISPCISLENFEVGTEVAEKFPDQFVDYESYDKPHIDLKSYIRHRLLEEGLLGNHIEVSPYCTMNDSARFYSYRRERNNAGRMLGLIKLRKKS